MVAGDLVLRLARPNQAPFQIMPRRGIVFTLLPSPVLHQHRDANGAVLAQLDGLVEESSKTPRIAIRRQTHDLILVGVEIESQVERDQRIENSQGIQG